jgi:kynurenine formamidase
MTKVAPAQAQLASLLESMAAAKTYDLAHPLEAGMPVSPNHPGFKMALQRRHGDMVRADGSSAANEMIMLGGHTGTHIDALCHVSHLGRLHGGIEAAEAQTGGRFRAHGVDTIPVTVCRGVLLDVAALRGVPVLEAGEAITAGDLQEAARRQGVEVRAGDAVLVRSGWARHWADPETFLGQKAGAPGPDESAARWLVERGVRLTGAETIAYEHVPAGRGHALLPVHRILLVDAGIHIIEAMNLDAPAADHAWEFLFVLAPLKVVGATGVPVRPVAIRP